MEFTQSNSLGTERVLEEINARLGIIEEKANAKDAIIDKQQKEIEWLKEQLYRNNMKANESQLEFTERMNGGLRQAKIQSSLTFSAHVRAGGDYIYPMVISNITAK